MSKVNYVREMEAFGDYAEANSLGSSERLVWLALFRAVNALPLQSLECLVYDRIRRKQRLFFLLQ